MLPRNVTVYQALHVLLRWLQLTVAPDEADTFECMEFQQLVLLVDGKYFVRRVVSTIDMEHFCGDNLCDYATSPSGLC